MKVLSIFGGLVAGASLVNATAGQVDMKAMQEAVKNVDMKSMLENLPADQRKQVEESMKDPMAALKNLPADQRKAAEDAMKGMGMGVSAAQETMSKEAKAAQAKAAEENKKKADEVLTKAKADKTQADEKVTDRKAALEKAKAKAKNVADNNGTDQEKTDANTAVTTLEGEVQEAETAATAAATTVTTAEAGVRAAEQQVAAAQQSGAGDEDAPSSEENFDPKVGDKPGRNWYYVQQCQDVADNYALVNMSAKDYLKYLQGQAKEVDEKNLLTTSIDTILEKADSDHKMSFGTKKEEQTKKSDELKERLPKCETFANEITADKCHGDGSPATKEQAEKAIKKLKWSVANANGGCCCLITIIVIIAAVVSVLVLLGVVGAVVFCMMSGESKEEEGVFDESSADETLAYTQ